MKTIAPRRPASWRRCAVPERAAIATGPATPERIYGCLRDCDVVLGMRLHALIFAATAGVPAVALSYDPKVDEIVKRLGIDKLDVKDLEAPDLARELVAALGSGAGKTAPLIEGLREAALENVRIALELLDNPPAELGTRLEGFDLLRRHTVEQENRAHPLRTGRRAWRCQMLEEEKTALQASLAQMRGLRSGRPAAIAGLGSQLAGLRDRLQFESDRRRKAESLAEEHAAQLQEQEQERAARSGRAWTAIGALFREQMAAYRSQRAWKVMLFFRKAYTMLLHRPRAAFLGWVLGLPFGRVGPARRVRAGLSRPRRLHSGYLPPPRARLPMPRTTRRPCRSEPDTPAPPNQYDVVILAIIDFDFRFQRPQQIAAELGTAGPPRLLDQPHPLPAARLGRSLRGRCRCAKTSGRSISAAASPISTWATSKPDDVQAMSAALGPASIAIGPSPSIPSWCSFPSGGAWRSSSARATALHLLYDCMDDWETFENMGAFNVSEESTWCASATSWWSPARNCSANSAPRVCIPCWPATAPIIPSLPRPGPTNCWQACPGPSWATSAPSPIGSISTWCTRSPKAARNIPSC